jgi:TonB-dependent starch-binding outer membrane protein SusC
MKKSRPVHHLILIQVLLLGLCLNSFGQGTFEKHIFSGMVYDQSTNEKLPGVNVYIKGTTTGTVTDLNGNYTLQVVKGKYTLVFSFVGYVAREMEVTVNENKVINLSLEPQKELLGEVQITSQRKFFGNMDYGREIPTISSKEIGKLTTSNASDILHARVAGVWATKTSGAPGDQQKIRIRGQASFFSSAEPLYVIDGVPVPIVNLASLGIADLNVNDIENVTVLKDASSTALYGYQGGNGVILIDTKQAKENSINFLVKTGIQWFDNFYDLMGTKDFLSSLKIASKKINSRLEYFNPAYNDTLCNHNRQEEIFKNGFVQEYQLSGSGTKNAFNYYLSGSYAKHTGILPNSLYERGTLTVRVGQNIGTKLAVGLSYRGSYQENRNNQNEYNGNRLIFEGISKSPCLEDTPDSMIYNPNPPPDMYKRIHFKYGILNSAELPQSITDNNRHELPIISHSGSFFGKYRIGAHLNVNLMESFMYHRTNYSSESDFCYMYDETTMIKEDVAFSSDEDVRLLNHQVNISYNNSFGASELNLLLAHRIYADNLNWEVDSMNNTLPEHYYLRNSMAGYGTKGSVIRQIHSYIAHAGFSFRKAWFVSAAANLSRLKEGYFIDYYTLFPSLSASWDISRELFLSSLRWLNELSFYANYGSSGNYPLNGLSNDLYDKATYSTGGEGYVYSPYVDQFANHYLKHESTAELNIGLKSSFYSDRLKINASWYSKKIGDQIIQRDIPMYYGGGKIFINMGNIDVKGYEIGIETTPVSTKDIEWCLNGNFSASEQKITKLIDGKDMVFTNNDILFPEFTIKEGSQLGDIYGYLCLGKWKEGYDGKNSYKKIGNMAFFNSDSTNRKLDENDKVAIGNSVPDFNWNISSSLRYKNFSLAFTLYSVWGTEKFNATRAGTIMTGVNREDIGLYNDSITALQYSEFYESSMFIDNASFIRFKTITIGYGLPTKIKGMAFSFSLSFENFLTISKYRGYDPEATTYTDNNFSDNAIDRGAYPSPKGILATVNLKF